MINKDEALPLDVPRVMGLETEYSLIHAPEASVPITTSSLTPALPSNLHTVNSFLSNGGRFYIDHNNHPEYATPECLTGKSVAVAAAAGEIITRTALRKVLSSVHHADSRTVSLFKRTIDSFGTAAGDHENYFVTQRFSPGELAPQLIPHLISRILFTGPGMITPEGKYVVDQRVWNMGDITYGGGSTNVQRPFVLSRDEPHSKRGHRVQVISGSANMMGQPTQFRFDSTSIALRLIEHRMLPDWLRVDNPATAMRHIASEGIPESFKFEHKIRTAGGMALTAAQIQYEYASRANTLGEAGWLNDYDAQFANRWAEMSQDAVDGKIDKWRHVVEWMVKLDLLSFYATSRAKDIDRLKQIDLQFHEMACTKEKTILTKLLARNMIEPISNLGIIKQAVYEAPDDTRARVRGAIVAELITKRASVPGEFNWSNWNVPWRESPERGEKKRWLQGNPYTTQAEYEEAA